jgi:hypothetical protein
MARVLVRLKARDRAGVLRKPNARERRSWSGNSGDPPDKGGFASYRVTWFFFWLRPGAGKASFWEKDSRLGPFQAKGREVSGKR